MEYRFTTETPGFILGVSGHRWPKLGGYSHPARKALLKTTITALEALLIDSEIDMMFNGGAVGFDQICIEAGLMLQIPITVVIPCEGYGNNWPIQTQEYFKKMLAKVTRVIVLQKKGTMNKSIDNRNYYIATRINKLLSCCDGTPSGTLKTIKYATDAGAEIINIYDDYRRLKHGLLV